MIAGPQPIKSTDPQYIVPDAETRNLALSVDNKRLASENNGLKQTVNMLNTQLLQLDAKLKSVRAYSPEVEMAKLKAAVKIVTRGVRTGPNIAGISDEALQVIDRFIETIFSPKE